MKNDKENNCNNICVRDCFDFFCCAGKGKRANQISLKVFTKYIY